jgi:prevent-host-death family protein
METAERIEAQQGLTPVLKRVAEGKEVVITENGRDVAKVSPLRHIDWDRRRSALSRLSTFGKGRNLAGVTLKDLINEGRRY